MVCWYAPIYTESVIYQLDSAFALWLIKIVALVLENSFVAQHGKTVCKTAWNEQLQVVIFAEFSRHVPTKCR